MKINKIAQAPVAQQPQQQPVQPQVGEQFHSALDPKMRTIFMQALQGTGLSKQKVLPFLEQLFTSMGDVPLSKVTGVIKALQSEEEVQAQQPQQTQQPQAQQPQQAQQAQQAVQAPDQGVDAQQTQTTVPPSG